MVRGRIAYSIYQSRETLRVHKLSAYRAWLAVCLSVMKASTGRGKQGESANQAAGFVLLLTEVLLSGEKNQKEKKKTELGEETEGCLKKRWR